MVGSYIQHQQCDRLLSFELLPYAEQPPKRALVDSVLGAVRAGEGQAFEAGVLAWLAQRGEQLFRVSEQDEIGRRLSLQDRQTLGLAYLKEMVQTAADQAPCRPQTLCILAQAVFMVPASNGEAMPVDGVGIPDLVEVALADDAVVLTVADIKDSAAPRYSQKWQVAFYAALIQQWLRHHTFALPVRMAVHGVLWTRPEAGDTAPSRHEFELAPYLDVFPLVAQHVTDILAGPLAEATWQLQSHCATCAYVDTCYRQALSVDDVMLTPHLTPGALLKLQERHLGALDGAAEWAQSEAQDDVEPLTGQQAAHLRTKIRALVENRVGLLATHTSLYPAQINTVVYLHMLRNPHSGRPRAWALYRWREAEESASTRCWIAATDADIAACHEAFYQQLEQWCRDAHLVTFGSSSQYLLSEEMQTDSHLLKFVDDIWSAEPPRHTDLRQLLRQHFALPIPLQYTLAAVARVWRLTPEPIRSSGDLLSDDERELEVVFMDDCLREDQVEAVRLYLESHMKWQQQVWQICTRHLRSDWALGVQVHDADAAPG
jgi:hypothetical protein